MTQNNIPKNLKDAKANETIYVTTAMEGKMKGIWSINSNPLINPFCQTMSQEGNTVCANCYSRKMLLGVRKMCVPCFDHNAALLSSVLIQEDRLPIIKREVFRFSAHGELINQMHLDNLTNIARKNPQTLFAWWTKRLDLKFTDLPNIRYVYSTPQLNVLSPALPEGFHKVFTVYTKPFIQKYNIHINCKGAAAGGCIHCLKCYSVNNTTHINEEIK